MFEIVKKNSLPKIEIIVDDVPSLTLYPNESINEKVIMILLREIQRIRTEWEFTFDGKPLPDYLTDQEMLDSVLLEQEKVVEELRTKNEEQETRIEMLETQLREANEAANDWAKKFKELKNLPEEKPS